MARVERYGKDEKMRWQSQVTLGTPSPPMLYNRHMECALLHASFPRVLLASVPAAIKDGIGHTSTLEALPSFALTSARGGHQEIVCYPQILKYDPLLFQDKVCSMVRKCCICSDCPTNCKIGIKYQLWRSNHEFNAGRQKLIISKP